MAGELVPARDLPDNVVPASDLPSRGGVGETVQGMIETGAPFAGALVGGFVGSGAGPVGAVGGATLGAMGGQNIAELTRPFLTGEETPFDEQLQEIVRTGLLEGMAEAGAPLVGRAVGTGIDIGRQFVKRKLIGEAMPEAVATTRRVFQKAKDFGAELSLGQITGGESGILDILENVAENSFFTAKRAGKFFGRQLDALRSVQDDFMKGLGTRLSASQAGRAIRALIDGSVKSSKVIGDTLFNAVRDSAQGVQIDTNSVVQLANRTNRLGSLSKEAMDKALDNGLDSLMSAVTTGGQTTVVPRITLDQAMTAKSQLLEFARENASSLDPAIKRLARTAGFLGGQMDDSIRTALSSAPPVQVQIGGRTATVQPLEMFDKANRFTQITKEAFENRVITRLTQRVLKEEPAQLVTATLRNERPEAIRKLKRAVGTSNFEQIVQPRLFRGLVEKHKVVDPARPEVGLVDGKALLSTLRNLGDEVVKESFGPRGRELTDLATAIEIAQTRATGPGKVFIQLAQAGAAVSTVTAPLGGRMREGALAIIIGPTLLGRLFFSPGAIRAFVDGLEAGPGSRQMARAMTLLSGLAARDVMDKRSDPDRLISSETRPFVLTGEGG